MQVFIDQVQSQKKYLKNEIIFLEETLADKFYYVVDGEISVFKTDSSGKEIEVNRLKKGYIFAEAFALAGRNYQVSAKAIQDTTLKVIAVQQLFEQLGKNPKLSQYLIQVLANRCIKLNQSIERLKIESVPVRLAKYLINMAKPVQLKNENTVVLVLEISKKDLASQIGTVPETLSRAFEKLETANLIKVSGKVIEILNISQLNAF